MIFLDSEYIDLVDILTLVHKFQPSIQVSMTGLEIIQKLYALTSLQGWELDCYRGGTFVPQYEARLNNQFSAKNDSQIKAISLVVLAGFVYPKVKEYEERNLSIGKLAEYLKTDLETTKALLRCFQVGLDLGVDTLEELASDIENAN